MNKDELKSILHKLNITPSKSKGQNFLLDQSVVERMGEVAQVGKDDLVIEIGPGLGVLTDVLAKRAKRVLVIELDRKIASYLRTRLPENVDLIEGDALASQTFHQMTGWLAHQQGTTLGDDVKAPEYQKGIAALDQSYKVVANLPYQITSKILRQLLEASPRPKDIVVMVQKEVGERMVAPSGKMSLLSLSTQVYSDASLAFKVPSTAFHPAPKVDSAIMHCNTSQPDEGYMNLSSEERDFFWKLAKMGFASRRKQLQNNLSSFEQIEEVLTSINLDPMVRAQELSPKEWVGLVKGLRGRKP